MGEMQQFKGGESEWVDWKFKLLNAVGSGSLTMRKVVAFAEESTEKGQGCDLRASDPEARGVVPALERPSEEHA